MKIDENWNPEDCDIALYSVRVSNVYIKSGQKCDFKKKKLSLGYWYG